MGTPITDAAHGFSLTIPDGFADWPAANVRPPILYAWAHGSMDAPPYTAIMLEAMGGTIEPGAIDPAAVAKGIAESSGGTMLTSQSSTVPWEGSSLEVFAGTMKVQGVTMSFAGTQFPLPREAVQVEVVSTGRAADATATVEAIASSLHGRNAWIEAGRSDYELGKLVGGVLGVALVVGLVFVVLRRVRR